MPLLFLHPSFLVYFSLSLSSTPYLWAVTYKKRWNEKLIATEIYSLQYWKLRSPNQSARIFHARWASLLLCPLTVLCLLFYKSTSHMPMPSDSRPDCCQGPSPTPYNWQSDLNTNLVTRPLHTFGYWESALPFFWMGQFRSAGMLKLIPSFFVVRNFPIWYPWKSKSQIVTFESQVNLTYSHACVV